MSTTKTLAFATLGLLAGCGGPSDGNLSNTPAEPGGQTDDASSQQVNEAELLADLQRLSELRIVEVGQLVHNYPEGAMNCYGPCPGFEEEIAEEDFRQAARLSELVEIVNSAVTSTVELEACTVEVIDANLEALDSLDIVEVFGLVEEVPQNNPYCYNTPCPSDIEAANEVNRQRATALAAIVEEAREL